MVNPFSSDYPRLTPYLTVEDGEAAIKFYTQVFGGVERMRLPSMTGGVGHAELAFGDGLIMLAEKDPMIGNKTPSDLGGSPVSITLYVEDVDVTVAKAIEHGATLVRDVQDQFYGDRAGTIVDPFGHIWSLMTHIEDVTPEQIQERVRSMMDEGPA